MLTRLDGLKGGLFWGELSESAPRFSFSMDMSLQHKNGGCIWDPVPWEVTGAAGTPQACHPYPVDRASGPGEVPGLKVPVVVALGMSLRSSLTQVATSMFICLARWNAFPGGMGQCHPGDTKTPGLSPAPTHPLTLLL